MKNNETKKCKCDRPNGPCKHYWISGWTVEGNRSQLRYCRKCGMTLQEYVDEVEARLESENLRRIM
jgi:hypothetical protein